MDHGERAPPPIAAPVAIPPDDPSGKPQLSIVLPYFRKLDEFRRVLPLNLPYFARAGIEVILALDENSQEADVLGLLKDHRQVRWKVVVNDVAHPWRPPCCAINVGLRHASGRYVLVASPESAFVGDVPEQALRVVRHHPNGIAVGRVAFARFDDLRSGHSLESQFAAAAPAALYLHTFYGSICGPTAAFESIRGYDETFATGGGDDDNVRVRLEMAGYTLLACAGIRLLHLSSEPRDGSEHYDPENDFLKCTPSSPQSNPHTDWGREFSRVAYVADVSVPAHGEGADRSPPTTFSPPPTDSVVPTGSRRRCDICGRLLHYDSPAIACAGCRSAPAIAGPTARTSAPPKIACVMQVRNEERYLGGCLAHLRDHVDGFIVLDDGSTDGTRQILEREGHLLDYLMNPPRDQHVWRERENKMRLLQRARDLGVDWVLCCDADERYERQFLDNLRAIAHSLSHELACVSVTMRELWNSPRQFRVDGIWGNKIRSRFFRVPREITFDLDADVHGQWYPDGVREQGRMVRIRHVLYHLKSIRREDRLLRRDFYNRIDPERRFQAVGYDYLADEGPDLRLEIIGNGREYRYDTLPPDLAMLLGDGD
jgi:GT2 family glycosyltransferase